jgi:hypothetical protein
VTVEWWIGSYNGDESANSGFGSEEVPLEVTAPNENGIYEIRYTPENPGTDYIYVKINGELLNSGEPFVHEVAPLSGDLEVAIETYVEEGMTHSPAPANGIPVWLYAVEEDGSFSTAGGYPKEQFTNNEGVATFHDELFGRYVVYLPERDFDVRYFDGSGTETHQQTVDHDTDPERVTFMGLTTALPDGVEVNRIGEANEEGVRGNGNAYQYVADNRSWTSAELQLRGVTLYDGKVYVQAHLATIKSSKENDHVMGLVLGVCPDPSRPRKCSQAWIGLTDDETDGQFKWVHGEGYLNPGEPSNSHPDYQATGIFTSWSEGEPSGKNNEDQVEINLFGEWSDENGASSTNDGYLSEYDVPDAPPPSPPGTGG